MAAQPDWPVQFAAVGKPRPEGSTAFKGMRRGKPIIVHDDPHLDEWRGTVKYAAHLAMHGRKPWTGPVLLELVFVMPAPAKLPRGRRLPEVKPDLDKLVRGVNDSLTGIVFKDDAQVVTLSAMKRYPGPDEQAGAIVRARPLAEQMVQETLDMAVAAK